MLPRDLETICLACLRKDPADRYATAAELADDLRRFLTGRPVEARPAGPVECAVKWVRRNPLPTALLGTDSRPGRDDDRGGVGGPVRGRAATAERGR